MHTEYIVSSRNLDKKIHCGPMDQGSPFEGHLHDLQFYFILCFVFYMWTMWTEIYMMFSKCKFHIWNQRAQSVRKIQYEEKQIKIILTIKKHTLCQKALQKESNKYSAYQLEKRCLLVKGCAATIFFGILIFQNIIWLSDVK